MNDLSSEQPKRSAGHGALPIEEDGPTMPLIGGILRPEGLPEAADLDVTALKSPNRTLNQGTMLIIGAFVIAAGVLYAMKVGVGHGPKEAVAKEVEQKIEQTLVQLSNPDLISPDSAVHGKNVAWVKDAADAFVDLFARDNTDKQVPIDYVKKNPFRLAIVRVEAPGAPAAQTDTAAAARLKKAQDEFKKLKLQTIMRGRPNVAVINDEICREGQKIGIFTIKTIDALSVVVTAEGQDFTLTMDSGPKR